MMGYTCDRQCNAMNILQVIQGYNKKLIKGVDQACPPIILPQVVNSGPSILPPSPLNQATISCGESVHLTLANRGWTVELDAEVKRDTRMR
jgi:hypothetical protein